MIPRNCLLTPLRFLRRAGSCLPWALSAAGGSLPYVILLLLCSNQALAAESVKQLEARLAKLSDAQKTELAANVKQFRELEPTKQQQLIKLQQKIESHPESQQLTAVMENFHDWFERLNDTERVNFRKMTDDQERVAYIRELLDKQRRAELKNMLLKLSPQDEEAIYAWVQGFVDKHKKQFLNYLPPELSRRLENMNDSQKRMQALMCIAFMKRMGPNSLRPNREDFLKLQPTISPEMRTLLDSQPDESSRTYLLHTWVLQVLWKKTVPGATEAKLAEFFQSLPPHRRDQLDNLSPGDRDRDLRIMYIMSNVVGFRPGDWNDHDNDPPPRFGFGGKGGPEGRGPEGRGPDGKGGDPREPSPLRRLGDLFRGGPPGGPPEPPPEK